MKISIITTVYKAEKDLPRLLDSMMAQKSPELEFYLIDNGSPDRCGEICQEYAAKDSRFTVCRLEENIGYIRARNYGISHCDADYIGFCDSDDFLEPGGYDHAIEKLKESDCDLYITAYRTVAGLNSVVNALPYAVGTYQNDDINNLILPAAFGPINGSAALHGFAWKQIFRKQLIDDKQCTFLPELQPYEDQIFNIDIIQNCQCIVIDDTILYNYIVNNESITAKMATNFAPEKEWTLIKRFFQAKQRRATTKLHRTAVNNQCLTMLYSLVLNLSKSSKPIKELCHFSSDAFSDPILYTILHESSKPRDFGSWLIRICFSHKIYFVLFIAMRSAIRLRNLLK